MSARFFEAANHAALYAKFRPSPPVSLIDSILDFVKLKVSSLDCAVDVGCGSGQSTAMLAPHFASVTGLDISKAQIEQAVENNTLPNVTYKESGAESLPLPASSVQLVTSGQACHWFDMPAFFATADRVLVPGGVLAIYGYKLPRVVQHSKAKQLTGFIDQMYEEKLHGYWGPDRIHVDSGYCDDRFKIPYLDSVRSDTHHCLRRVSAQQLTGYISSWSGYQGYTRQHGEQAGQQQLQQFLDRVASELGPSTHPLAEPVLDISYPYFLLMGRKPSSS